MAPQSGPGGHWSAANPIPTIQKFVENLDKDKRDRDQQIDDEIKRRQQDANKSKQAVDNEVAELANKKARHVTDPVTGREVSIADVDKQYMAEVENPSVSRLFHVKKIHDANTLATDYHSKCKPRETNGKYDIPVALNLPLITSAPDRQDRPIARL